ncbi:hypothetical protein DESC_740148 [Desulfosarcina cetonica]|nr:hypothetical protein DESC_740148 [Desulfosarcina cetonica]
MMKLEQDGQGIKQKQQCEIKKGLLSDNYPV